MYYPKSQITPNLYTNGNEFVILDSNQPYVGYYYKLSNGKYYTGRNQDDLPNQQLKQLEYSDVITTNNNTLTIVNIYEENNESYLNIRNTPPKQTFIPKYNPEIPTQNNYEVGEFVRYFCKKVNDLIYIEIDNETFLKLLNKDSQIEYSLYQPFKLTWIIRGDVENVYKININSTLLLMKQLPIPMFNFYLKNNYTKYLI